MSAPDFAASHHFSGTAAYARRERALVSRRFFGIAMSLGEAVADFFACVAGTMAANFLCSFLMLDGFVHYPLHKVVVIGASVGIIVFFLGRRDGSYKKDSGLLRIRETERALSAGVQASCLLLLVAWILGLDICWPEIPFAVVLIPTLLVAEKLILFSLAGKLQPVERMERVIVYGAGDTARRFLSTVIQSPRLGLVPVAVIDAGPAQGSASMLEMGYRGRASIPVQPGPITASQLKATKTDILVLASPDLSREQVAEATEAADQAGIPLAFLGALAAQDPDTAETLDIDGVSLTASKAPAESALYEFTKRAVDLLASAVLLALLAPVLVFIAILIRLDSQGPALFVQERIGRNGAHFNIFKFRSMFTAAPKYARSPTSSIDPRITRVGRLLRRTSLDELPQLLNVFLGTMSLVGPRPEMPFIAERYDLRQSQRLQVPPGITCLWQLSADRSFPIHENIQYDLYYIRNRSFYMDAAILVHTLLFALSGGT